MATINGKTIALGFRNNFTIDGSIVAAAKLMELVKSAKPSDATALNEVQQMAKERIKYLKESRGKNWTYRRDAAKRIVDAISEVLGNNTASSEATDPAKYRDMTPKALNALKRRTKNPEKLAAMDAAAAYFDTIEDEAPAPKVQPTMSDGSILDMIAIAKRNGIDLNHPIQDAHSLVS